MPPPIAELCLFPDKTYSKACNITSSEPLPGCLHPSLSPPWCLTVYNAPQIQTPHQSLRIRVHFVCVSFTPLAPSALNGCSVAALAERRGCSAFGCSARRGPPDPSGCSGFQRGTGGSPPPNLSPPYAPFSHQSPHRPPARNKD